MNITIASWNIEKNGQSSTDIKQTKVSEFIDICCNMGISVIFLCEVHSARVDDYVTFANNVYGQNYDVYNLPGGHSNAYILLTSKDINVMPYHDDLKGLNRGCIILMINEQFFLGLAHFKSGQTGLTASQISNASFFLHEMGNNSGKWAIAGDMNWQYQQANLLRLPFGVQYNSCWPDQTQKKGNILDWCLSGHSTTITPFDVNSLFSHEVNDMTGPDHRPVIFGLSWES